MKILVCGGRNFTDEDRLHAILDQCCVGFFQELNEHAEIISGGASGADKMAAKFAKGRGIISTVVLPDWGKHKKAAGFIRNQAMIDLSPNLVIAFWDGKSKGTKDTITRAKKKGITTLVVYY